MTTRVNLPDSDKLAKVLASWSAVGQMAKWAWVRKSNGEKKNPEIGQIATSVRLLVTFNKGRAPCAVGQANLQIYVTFSPLVNCDG